MANELEHLDTTGLTIYAKPLPLVASPWGDDAVAMTETGTTGYYSADVASPANRYAVYQQAGASPAATDVAVATIAVVVRADDRDGEAIAKQTTAATAAAQSTAAASQTTAEAIRGAVGLASDNLDAQLSAISADAGDAATDAATLASRLTSDRAGYLDKLNVSGTLANTDNASAFKADVSGLSTLSAEDIKVQVDAALDDIGLDATVVGRIDAAISTRSTLSAAGVWAHTDRSLTDKGGFTLDSTAVDAIRDGLATSEQVSQITAKLPSSAYLAGSDSEDGAVTAEVDAGEVAAAVLANPDNKIATNASGQVETSNPAVQRIVKVVQRQIKVITN